MNTSRLPLVLLLATGLALPATASAAPRGSFVESRGDQTCLAAAARSVELHHVGSRYYVDDRNDAARQYYLNGYANIDGANMWVKIDCLTTVNGRRVETLSVAPGEFVGRLIERPVVVSTD
jgi:hypothetical protein